MAVDLGDSLSDIEESPRLPLAARFAGLTGSSTADAHLTHMCITPGSVTPATSLSTRPACDPRRLVASNMTPVGILVILATLPETSRTMGFVWGAQLLWNPVPYRTLLVICRNAENNQLRRKKYYAAGDRIILGYYIPNKNVCQL